MGCSVRDRGFDTRTRSFFNLPLLSFFPLSFFLSFFPSFHAHSATSMLKHFSSVCPHMSPVQCMSTHVSCAVHVHTCLLCSACPHTSPVQCMSTHVSCVLTSTLSTPLSCSGHLYILNLFHSYSYADCFQLALRHSQIVGECMLPVFPA